MNKPNDPRLYVALAVLGFLGGGTFLYFQYTGLTDLDQEVRVLDNKVRSQRDLPAQLELSQRDLDTTRSKLAHLERNVPEFAYVPTMLRELETLGKSSGLKVIGVRPVEKSDNQKIEEAKGVDKPYQEIEITVTSRGSYPAILRFVSALNAFPKIVGTRAVSIEPKRDPLMPKDQKPPLELTTRLRAYVFEDGQVPEAQSSASKATAAKEGTYRAG